MKNIRLFEEASQYEAVKDSFKYPTVSYTKDNGLVWYMEKPQSLYEWVDLGLPSGLLWADRNVGATKPEEYGLYFQWGETQGYSGITAEKGFRWGDYTLCDGTSSNILKYNATDGLKTLELSDDAAYATDNTCRMPTKTELEELTANTTSAFTQVNGVSGMTFTSKVNGNSIFVPAAGECYQGSFEYVGQYGNLWSSSLNESDLRNAFYLGFTWFSRSVSSDFRCYGYSLRPVLS